jgi:hypothetical protein
VSAKKVYKVLVIGAGKRGKHHAQAFKNNPRFELAGLSDVSPEQLAMPRPNSVFRKPRCNLSLSRKKSNPTCSVSARLRQSAWS